MLCIRLSVTDGQTGGRTDRQTRRLYARVALYRCSVAERDRKEPFFL